MCFPQFLFVWLLPQQQILRGAKQIFFFLFFYFFIFLICFILAALWLWNGFSVKLLRRNICAHFRSIFPLFFFSNGFYGLSVCPSANWLTESSTWERSKNGGGGGEVRLERVGGDIFTARRQRPRGSSPSNLTHWVSEDEINEINNSILFPRQMDQTAILVKSPKQLLVKKRGNEKRTQDVSLLKSLCGTTCVWPLAWLKAVSPAPPEQVEWQSCKCISARRSVWFLLFFLSPPASETFTSCFSFSLFLFLSFSLSISEFNSSNSTSF